MIDPVITVLLDESGRIVAESKTTTSPKAMEAAFGAMRINYPCAPGVTGLTAFESNRSKEAT